MSVQINVEILDMHPCVPVQEDKDFFYYYYSCYAFAVKYTLALFLETRKVYILFFGRREFILHLMSKYYTFFVGSNNCLRQQ